MAKVRPLVQDKQIEYDLKELTNKMLSDITTKGIPKQEIARLSGITPGALSQQLKNKRITINTYLAWQRLSKEREK